MAKKKRASIGCLFWFALLLVALVVFLFSREAIQRVLEKTGFLGWVQKGAPEQPVEVVVEPERRSPDMEPAPGPDSARTEAAEEANQEPAREKESTTNASGEETQSPPGSAAVQRYRQGRLYFVQIDDEGQISVSGLTRSIPYTDAPLAETLNALLQGPSPAETARGFLTLIPQDSRIDGLTVRDGTAYVSFNESFRINTFGREGLMAQLEQVVYTATDFPTVRRVQILINGQLAEYLSAEGIRIHEPLTRDSFRNGGL